MGMACNACAWNRVHGNLNAYVFFLFFIFGVLSVYCAFQNAVEGMLSGIFFLFDDMADVQIVGYCRLDNK